MTPDPQNRIQTILGAFTGLLSGYSQRRCRDKIKNMDFQVSLGHGRRAAAETFIFLFSRLPPRVRDVLGIYYYLFIYLYYVLVDVYQEVPVGLVRVGVYYLIYLFNYLYYIIIYIYIYGALCYNLVRENFYKYVRRGWKCYPQMRGGTARKSRKMPHRRILTASPPKTAKKSRI